MNRLPVAALSFLAFVSASIQKSDGTKVGPDFFAKKQHRAVTISLVKPDDLTVCRVDFPVAVVSIVAKQTIAWAAEDANFWVVFDDSPGPIGSKTIPIPKDTLTLDYPITIDPKDAKYFKYAIWSVDPDHHPTGAKACKGSDDDHDTGLNVKP